MISSSPACVSPELASDAAAVQPRPTLAPAPAGVAWSQWKLGPYALANPWILAPMAGVSEMPFRVLVRRMGAAAAPTELISAKGLVYGQARTMRYLDHDKSVETPFWAQLFGGDEASMVEGGQRAVALGAQILDINMGCPVRKVVRHGAGSSLLCDPAQAARLVYALAKATNVPVTVKIRAGWDAHSLTYRELAKRFADAGAVAVAMHARTRAQGYSGEAHWPWLTDLVAHSPIPVIGNGDAFTPALARRLLAETGCAAVMVGRGALGDPWLFSRLASGCDEYPTPAARWQLIHAHFEAHMAFVGDPLRGIKRFRPHLLWYARGLRGAVSFRRDIVAVTDCAELLDRCEAFFAQQNFERAPGSTATEAIDFDVGAALG